jgi:hypothetical protein
MPLFMRNLPRVQAVIEGGSDLAHNWRSAMPA